MPNATETEAGKVEKGTAAEAQSATDNGTSGPLYIAPSVLAAEIIRRLTPEAWHAVGAAGEPAFQNGWVNFGGTFDTVAFRKTPTGRMELKGTMKSGTQTAAFVLPAGYRPAADKAFAAVKAAATVARMIVDTNGNVVVNDNGGSSAFVSLEGIGFST